MNKHDFLDLLGGIDNKYIKAAGEKKTKRKIYRYYYLAAAALLLMVVGGVVLKNNMLIHTPSEEVPTGGIETATPEVDGEEEASTMTAEGSVSVTEETAGASTGAILMNDEFNSSLIAFLEERGYLTENYMVSPTSFRAAIALAVAGADNETKDELLIAMGFKDMDELNAWYQNVASATDSFDEWLKFAKEDFKNNKEFYGDDATAPEGSFDIENSIWRNTKSRGKLSKKYIKYVAKNYGATAENVGANNITDKVNNWINKNTNGLIPSISNDLSYADLVLVNTLYLRTSWIDDFATAATRPDDFTTISGEKVSKPFMHQSNRYRYYEDESGKFVVIPMNGGINAVFVLGDVDNVVEKMQNASYEQVDVSLPKFETETSLSDNILIDYCKERGAESAFSANADFSVMSSDMKLYITDIIQKTKIKVDEEGIEAAAATAVMMTEGAVAVEPEVKEFNANEPFKYMLLTDGSDPELLFYGQIVK